MMVTRRDVVLFSWRTQESISDVAGVTAGVT